ncbi:hypothetical protein BDQ12DRAFT_128805 [Crucibulum laeve]|uniref:Uncharacterized protein n=1 Tax=Crucibulum laeve TaxID=68775 RepID=A0A5C3LFC7_9AGAR|nr:hypothetical protein BDQ12DRAFT_128805 [Crucibulum laeve]
MFFPPFTLAQEHNMDGYHLLPSSPLRFPSSTTQPPKQPRHFLFPSFTYLSLRNKHNPLKLLALNLLLPFPVLKGLKMGGLGVAGSSCIELQRALVSTFSMSSDLFDCFTSVTVGEGLRFEAEYEDTDEEDAALQGLPRSLKKIVLQARLAPTIGW